MKKNLFVLIIILSLMGYEAMAATTFLGNYRWRNDDGNEVKASWLAAENDSIIKSDASPVRVRMEVYHTADAPVDYNGFLYYASLNDTVWHLVTEDPSDAFMYSASTHVNNGIPTTEQLSKSIGSNTTEPGMVRTMAGTFQVTMTKDVRKEYEFSIKPSPNVDYDQTFIFLVEDIDPNEFSGVYLFSMLPRMHLKKPVLTATANDATRAVGAANPSVGVTYSGFVDGDDESVLNTAPQIAHTADGDSPEGTYDIVPYGGEDNKYAFTYVTGTLTVSGAVGISGSRKDMINIHPNPARDILFITGMPHEIIKVKIFDISGRLKLDATTDKASVNISRLEKGMYFLNVDGKVFRFMKE